MRSEGRLARVGIIRVHAAVNPVGTARIGLAVPRVRSAVSRNRIRRRLRAAGVALTAHEGFDLVVSAGEEVLRLPFGELRAQVNEAARLAVARAHPAPGGPGGRLAP
ncbi:MAG: ribonuclease P protein component [Candidatus Dormibacteria bacterium]